MRIGVTGSSGLIGTALVSALRQRGDEVVRFIRPSSSTTTETHVRWNPVTGDVDERDLARIGGLDGIIHLAGAGIADHRWSASYRAEIMNSRTATTSMVVAVAAGVMRHFASRRPRAPITWPRFVAPGKRPLHHWWRTALPSHWRARALS